MALKSIRVSEKNYKCLLREAAKLQIKRGERVSIDDAVGYLLNKYYPKK
jgi:hypothetical protein